MMISGQPSARTRSPKRRRLAGARCAASVDGAKVWVNRLRSKKVCNHCTLLCNGCTLFLTPRPLSPLLQGESAKFIIDMTKAELEKKKSTARALFLSGMEQAEIADHLGVSRVTISKWCVAEGWKKIRAAKNITRPELVNKLLLTIDNLLTQVNESKDPALMGGLGDKLAKFGVVIEKLDQKTNVVDAITVCTAFSNWLELRAKTDPEVTVEFIKQINNFHNMFIIESVGKGSLAG